MRVLTIAILLFCLPSLRAATTHYMRADGTAASWAAAIGPASSQAACASVTFHNANSVPAGDTVLLSSQGGVYTTNMVLSPQSTINYANVPGETPVMSLVAISGKTNGSITGLTWNYSGPDNNGQPLSLVNCTNWGLTNLYITQTTGYGLVINGGCSNIVLDGFTNTGVGILRKFGLYSLGTPTNQTMTYRNIYDDSATGINITMSSNTVISNVVRPAGSSGSTGITVSQCTGPLLMSQCLSSNSQSTGIKFLNNSFTAGSMATNCTVIGAQSPAFLTQGVTNLTIVNCNVLSNAAIGFRALNSQNISYLTNSSLSSSGDGFYASGCSNFVYTSCLSSNNTGMGFDNINGVTNFTYTSCISDGNKGVCYYADGTSNPAFGFTYSNCIGRFCQLDDGFSVKNGAHDITYSKCISYGNGDIKSTANGDGFTGHDTCYNIYLNQCIAYSNKCTGYAYVTTASGHLFNCIAYKNGADYTSVGGTNQNRAGFYFNLSGNNPTSGYGFQITNCIGVVNYPREILFASQATPFVTLDYNDYLPISNTAFASLDGGTTTISWTAYDALFEAHSTNADPVWVNPATPDFHLASTLSPCFNTGFNTGFTNDFDGNPIWGAMDIGPYEAQAGVKPLVSKFPAISLGNTTNIISDNGTAITYNGGLLGSTPFPVFTLKVDNTTSGSGNDSTEDNLTQYTIPANTLSTDLDYLEIEASYFTSANTNQKRIRAYLGGTMIYSSGLGVLNADTGALHITITRVNATSQNICAIINSAFPSSVAVGVITAGAENLANPLIFKLTGQGNALNDVVQKGLIIKVGKGR